MRLLKSLLKLVGLLVLVSAIGIGYVLWRGGVFRTLAPGFAGSCESLPLSASAEDLTVDHERGLLYLSYLDRQSLVRGEGAQGTILRLDLTTRPFRPVEALLDKPEHLRPHGLSLYTDTAGRRTLFVINHPVNRGTEPELVEIFDEVAPGSFRHRQTVTSPLFHSPNDLAAVGPAQFYVANDKAPSGGLAAGLQQVGIGASPVTFFDGSEARVVADDIASGGGINVSRDGTTVYVAETSGQRLRAFRREPLDGSLTESARIPLPTSPDNIDVAPDGSLTVAGHANTLKLIQHFISGSPAPTQVLRVLPGNGSPPVVEALYVNDGAQISAGSVGVTWQKLLLIGSITARQLLVCEQR